MAGCFEDSFSVNFSNSVVSGSNWGSVGSVSGDASGCSNSRGCNSSCSGYTVGVSGSEVSLPLVIGLVLEESPDSSLGLRDTGVLKGIFSVNGCCLE